MAISLSNRRTQKLLKKNRTTTKEETYLEKVVIKEMNRLHIVTIGKYPVMKVNVSIEKKGVYKANVFIQPKTSIQRLEIPLTISPAND